MNRDRNEPIGEPLVRGNGRGAEELVGKTIVFLLSNQKVRVVHPKDRAGEGHFVASGLHVQHGAIELAELLLPAGGYPVVDGEATPGEVGVPGVGVLEPILGASEGEPAIRRIVEPEVIPDLQVALSLVLGRREDQDQVLLLRVPAEDHEVRGGDPFPRFGLHHQVLGGKISLGKGHEGVDPFEEFHATQLWRWRRGISG